MKRIEAVCTGNHGRSPLAEIIIARELERLKLNGRYVACSSGSHVKDNGVIDNETKQAYINQALDIGLYREGEVDHFYNAIMGTSMDEAQNAIDQFYKIAKERLNAEEEVFREIARARLGLNGEFKPTIEQTVARPDTAIIWTMADSNRDRVLEIYASVPEKPLIENLAAYALRDVKAGIPDAFGGTIKDYMATARAIAECVPKAILRARQEKIIE